MSKPENDVLNVATDAAATADVSGLSRRKFLGGLGGAAAATMAAGVVGGVALEPLMDAAATAEAAPGGPSVANHRSQRAWQIRKDMADYWKGQSPVTHLTNGDEARYPSRIGNWSKGMPHNQFGEVDPAAYNSFLKAIDSGKPEDYDAIILGSPGKKLTNPQSGLAFDMQGIDCQAATVPPPPALASREQASEIIEHYWQALLRDTNFLDYGSSADATAACADLNAFGADFKGVRIGGVVTPQTLFRDIGPGMTVGPYISQFMWLNTPYGAEQIDRRTWTLAPGSDHLQTFDDYLASQHGLVPQPAQFLGLRRYIINGRDLAEWVHIDVLYQAYFNAMLIMATPPDNSDNGGGLGVGLNPGNPYIGNPTQAPFTTFGPPGIATLLTEVSSRCLKATWHKKFQIHRRLRPEHHAGRIEVHLNQSPGRYNGALHPDTFNATALDRIETHNGGSYLLPIAFPEGCPTHPSYTAGHATVAGACVTLLKAMFDTENHIIQNPVVPTPDGSALVPYVGPALTVEGELNKVASNVATGRNIAGMHWRSDAWASMRLGQKVAISLLQEQTKIHNEPDPFYTFRGFDGERIVVRNGGVTITP